MQSKYVYTCHHVTLSFSTAGGTWHQHEDFLTLLRDLHRQNVLLLAWQFPGHRSQEEEPVGDRMTIQENRAVFAVD